MEIKWPNFTPKLLDGNYGYVLICSRVLDDSKNDADDDMAIGVFCLFSFASTDGK